MVKGRKHTTNRLRAKQPGGRGRKRGSPKPRKPSATPLSPAGALRIRIQRRLKLDKKIASIEAEHQGSVQLADVVSADRILRQLPSMQPDQLVRIWKNAIRLILKTGENSAAHTATTVRNAVEVEWQKRGLSSSNNDEYFSWPSTEASGGSKNLSFAGKIAEGMLSYLEYRVGKVNGEAAPIRRAILDRVFGAFLPPAFPKEYMDQWGAPNSASRLQKLAESLAAFVRNAKRRDPDVLDEAIRQWEEDLQYLYEKYYVGRFHFGWPSANLV